MLVVDEYSIPSYSPVWHTVQYAVCDMAYGARRRATSGPSSPSACKVVSTLTAPYPPAVKLRRGRRRCPLARHLCTPRVMHLAEERDRCVRRLIREAAHLRAICVDPDPNERSARRVRVRTRPSLTHPSHMHMHMLTHPPRGAAACQLLPRLPCPAPAPGPCASLAPPQRRRRPWPPGPP